MAKALLTLRLYFIQQSINESHNSIYPIIGTAAGELPRVIIEDDLVGAAGIDGTNVHYRKVKKSSSHLDNKSPAALHGRPLSFNRTSSYAPSMGGQSHHSSDHDHLIPPPSTEKEKSKMTRRYFATVFAISYAIFLVIFGAVVFVGDAFVSQYPLPQVSATI